MSRTVRLLLILLVAVVCVSVAHRTLYNKDSEHQQNAAIDTSSWRRWKFYEPLNVGEVVSTTDGTAQGCENACREGGFLAAALTGDDACECLSSPGDECLRVRPSLNGEVRASSSIEVCVDDPPPPGSGGMEWGGSCDACYGGWCERTFADEPDEWGTPVLVGEACRQCGADDPIDTYRDGCGETSPGILKYCDFPACGNGGILVGCGGNSAGECVQRTTCASGETCVTTSERDDCSCMDLSSLRCAPGTEAVEGGGCRVCNDATRSSGYHYYSADAPLLRQAVHLYLDAVTQKAVYRARLYSTPDYMDKGELIGVPERRPVQWGLLRVGDVVTVDTGRGVVYKLEPRRDPRYPERAVDVYGFSYDQPYTKFMAVIDEEQRKKLPLYKTWSATLTSSVGSYRAAVSGAPLIAVSQGRPDVTFTNPPGAPDSDVAIAVQVRSQRALQVDSAKDDPSLFDYSEFAWASGDAFDNDWEEFLGSKSYPVPPAHTMNRVIELEIPRGRWDEASNSFAWDRGPLQRIRVMNRARPQSCLSCKAREARECPSGTLLVGCGFAWSGYCSSCYQSPAEPCGNCQSTRLRAKLPDGRYWTDAAPTGDLVEQLKTETGPLLEPERWPLQDTLEWGRTTGDHAAGEGARARIAEVCSAMPDDLCAWRDSALKFDVPTRFSGQWSLDPYVHSTVEGKSFPPFCCKAGDVRTDGPSGEHCVYARGEPYVRASSPNSPGGMSWTRVPWAPVLNPSLQGTTITTSPLNWPDLAQGVEFYEFVDGSGQSFQGGSATKASVPFTPQSCLLSALTSLTIYDSGNASYVLYNTSVRVTFYTFQEVGWVHIDDEDFGVNGKSVSAYKITSVVAHPTNVHAPAAPPPSSSNGPRLRGYDGVPGGNPMSLLCYKDHECGGTRGECQRAECYVRGRKWTGTYLNDSNCGNDRWRGGICHADDSIADLRVWDGT